MVEDTLIKHPDFALPGRKALLKSDMAYEVVLIDATETPIERPKKTEILLLWQEKKAHVKDAGDRRKAGQTDYCDIFLQREAP